MKKTEILKSKNRTYKYGNINIKLKNIFMKIFMNKMKMLKKCDEIQKRLLYEEICGIKDNKFHSAFLNLEMIKTYLTNVNINVLKFIKIKQWKNMI